MAVKVVKVQRIIEDLSGLYQVHPSPTAEGKKPLVENSAAACVDSLVQKSDRFSPLLTWGYPRAVGCGQILWQRPDSAQDQCRTQCRRFCRGNRTRTFRMGLSAKHTSPALATIYSRTRRRPASGLRFPHT